MSNGSSGFNSGFGNSLGGDGFGGGFSSSSLKIPTSGLLLHLDATRTDSYPGSGATWFDLADSPVANNATLVNSPAYSTNNGGYFTFAKTSSQSATVSGNNVVPSAAYTKSVWFYLTDLTSDNNLVSSDVGGHFMFFAGTNKLYCGHANWLGGLAYTQYPSTTNFVAVTWYHVVLTYTATDGMTLYVNGVLDSTYTTNKTAHNGTGATNIGRFGAGNFLNGRVSQVLTYDRAIGANEVTKIYDASKSLYGL